MNEQLEIWQQIQNKLEENLGIPAFELWLKPIRFDSIDENYIVVSTTNNNAKKWIYTNYLQLITRVVKEVTGNAVQLKINVNDFEVARVEKKPETEEKSTNFPLSESQIDTIKSLSNNLNLRYTFDSFVIGSHNKFCHAAALAVAKFPAQAHNPLFIYGGVGLGKTHLMHAIGHYILVHHPHLKIKYTSTEMFTNDLINSIRMHKTYDFRTKYRQIDVLLLDDIQFLEGKDSTQEEMFHTFNALHESGKQIIMTSDRPPNKISTLTERLRSRFEWGLLADIQPPDIETRIAILKNKVERDNVSVPDEVLELIATVYKHNIRELEGALNRVIAYVSINDCSMTIDTVKKIINFSTPSKNLTVNRIIEVTAKYFSLESSELKGQCRSKEISKARQIAVYLTRELTKSSYPAIGQSFGGRKHTTILYAYEKMKTEIATNNNLAEIISELSHKINSNNNF